MGDEKSKAFFFLLPPARILIEFLKHSFCLDILLWEVAEKVTDIEGLVKKKVTNIEGRMRVNRVLTLDGECLHLADRNLLTPGLIQYGCGF